MRERVLNILIFLFYFLGVIIYALPDLRWAANSIYSNAKISEFRKIAEEAAQEGTADSSIDDSSVDNSGTDDSNEDGSANSDTGNYQELYEQMQEYNTQIYEDHQSGLTDPWSFEQSSIDLSAYGLESDVIAILEIPKMSLELPIYLGATSENMAKGAVNLGQTSLPIGGENTNCVIAAHRGYRGIPMFREITSLEIGDEVIITNLWETLTYQVTEIKVILPTDVQEIYIQEGKDMVTLLTCHPYTKNYQRYAVFCERVTDENEETSLSDGGTELEALTDSIISSEVLADSNESIEEDEDDFGADDDEILLAEEKCLRRAGYLFLVLVGIVIAARMVRKPKHGAGKNGGMVQ